MTDSPAEEIRNLLDQLHGQVETRERVPHYKQVRRSKDRTTLTLDWRDHTTKEPGLLAQLGVTAAHHTTVPVDIRRWTLDNPDPEHPERCANGCTGKCWHGHWTTIRTEQRHIPTIATGAAVPGGSPGWDADGALSPIVAGGKPESAEPIAEEWHVGYEIQADLAAIGRDLYEQGHRPPATLITIALDHPDVGEWIVRRLRSLVARARIAADYDAPIMTLRDYHCPICGGPMRVRQDASSDVWCGGMLPVYGPEPLSPELAAEPRPIGMMRCQARWPRGGWVNLLAQQEAS